MSTEPDNFEQENRVVTRSGRIVRPPQRYEPDPDQILEDDYSDVGSSDEEWECDEDDDGMDSSDSQDSSYESSSEFFSSVEDDIGSDDFFVDTDQEEFTQEDKEEYDDSADIIEWDTLTADASDEQSSEDDDERDSC